VVLLDISIWVAASIFIIAFLAEYTDSTLGMGYGTTLTPILLLYGFSPLQVVPSILLSELITGLMAGFFHHLAGNVDFKPKDINLFSIRQELNELGYLETFAKGLPLHLRVALLLAACSIVGTIVAVFIAFNIPGFWIKLYIGILVFSMGIVIIMCLNREFVFSWKKIILLGMVSSFNKGISGGGYGPIITGGQILSGIEGRHAVGITSLAEGLTCMVGVVSYLLIFKGNAGWQIAPFIISGAVLSVPFSVISVKKVKGRSLKLGIAALTLILGTITIVQTLING
jgi:uncharacterized membrane protein YfcA